MAQSQRPQFRTANLLLTFLREGQRATVLQVPAAKKQPASSAEMKNHRSRGSSLNLFEVDIGKSAARRQRKRLTGER